MLTANEFSAGTLSKAEPLTLVLPRSGSEKTILVVPGDGEPTAVFLSQEDQFMSFECGSNTAWGGLLVPRVRVEVDETSAFHAMGSNVLTGSLCREGKVLSVVTRGYRRVTVVGGLEPTEPGQSVAFSRWRVVVGEGAGTRVLHQVDLGGVSGAH